jgi:hypothetical protein
MVDVTDVGNVTFKKRFFATNFPLISISITHYRAQLDTG